MTQDLFLNKDIEACSWCELHLHLTQYIAGCMLSRRWRSSLKKNRKSFSPFVSFLLLMSQTPVDTFCCFITLPLWCLRVCMYMFQRSEVIMLNASSSSLLPWLWEERNQLSYFFSVFYSVFPHSQTLSGLTHFSHTHNYRPSKTHPKHMCPNCLYHNCVCMLHFVCSLFWVGQCLLLGLPLIVSGSSDCRLYFRQSRNVLLTILVLTDWHCCLAGLKPNACISK